MYDDLMKKHGFVPFDHKAPNFFPVGTGPVFDQAGKHVPGYLRVQREDSGDTLAIHSDSYALMPYERHFDLFETAIEESGLGRQQVMIGTDLDKNGARIYRQYLFPDVTHAIQTRRGETRDIALRILMFDSYDGSSAFIGKAGFFDFACANTAFIGKALADVKYRHVGDMEEKVKLAAEQLVAAAEDFPRQVTRMKQWTGVELLADQVEQIIKSIPQGGKALTNEIVTMWAKEGDATLWGLHQALTSWATHVPHPRTAVDRSKRIAGLLEGVEWKEYEPA